MKENW